MKGIIWQEPCGCGTTETNKDGKEVAQYNHSRVHGDTMVDYSPLQAQLDGFDADGAPVPAPFPLQ